MFSNYTLFPVDRKATGVNGLSPKSDDVVSSSWTGSSHSPIGKSPVVQPNTPPHIIDLFRYVLVPFLLLNETNMTTSALLGELSHF